MRSCSPMTVAERAGCHRPSGPLADHPKTNRCRRKSAMQAPKPNAITVDPARKSPHFTRIFLDISRPPQRWLVDTHNIRSMKQLCLIASVAAPSPHTSWPATRPRPESRESALPVHAFWWPQASNKPTPAGSAPGHPPAKRSAAPPRTYPIDEHRETSPLSSGRADPTGRPYSLEAIS